MASQTPSGLPLKFIQGLTASLDGPGILGIALTGSHARGQEGPFSDVDLDIFMDPLPSKRSDRYSLHCMDDRLVSLKYISLEDEIASLSRPWDAIWAVPGVRRMQILVDRQGKLAGLQHLAEEFDWVPLQPAADEYAIEQLMGCAEEVHKIMNGLARSDESAVLYAVWGLVKDLASAVATQRALLVESENRYFDILQDAVGRQSQWTKAFRLAIGAEPGPGSQSPFHSRGVAALGVYSLTTSLFREILHERHRKVIENTNRLIREAGYQL